MHSRYTDATYVHPDPESDRAAFVDHLTEYLTRTDHAAVLPVCDHSSLVLSRHKERLEGSGTTVAVEDWPTFETAFDKAKLASVLAATDVPAPETYAPSSTEAAAALADDVDYPVVVKPRSKSHLVDGGYTVTLVGDDNYVDSPTELRRVYGRIAAGEDTEDAPLIQEYVAGTTTATVALAHEGDVRSYFQEKRLRTYPASGGNSALLGAVREPTMLTYTRRVLERLEWTGPAMVEFMETPDGEFYVIEVNGRYWGSLPFAIACGVDVPWHHYLQLRGVDPSPLIEFGDYRTDVRQRRLLYEDIKWLGENLADGNLGATVPFVRDFGRSRLNFVDLGDPVPTVGSLLQGLALGVGAARRSVFR
jgi:predicted ATP-grasp superfamily ATP-dependent carboligase